MDLDRVKQLKKLQKNLKISFNNLNLLNIACTHRSYSNENSSKDNYEKLEFLGDSILSFVVTEYLYFSFSKHEEGNLSKIKSMLVNKDFLASIAKDLNLNQFILLGKGEKQSLGMNRNTILSDVLEAVIGAYYIDSDIKKVSQFIISLIDKSAKKIEKKKNYIDYKTYLQLEVQKKDKICPIYKTIKTEGPDHNKEFYVEVYIKKANVGSGNGSNKKIAQQSAARNALLKLGYLNKLL